jgi:hypothetical protein
MRKHAAWYLKGLYGSAAVRDRVNQTETPDAMRDVLLRYLEQTEQYALAQAATADLDAPAPQSCDAYSDDSPDCEAEGGLGAQFPDCTVKVD